ncbi:class I SAM-dependent methyltransferase [Nocardia fusca]|uniref:Class I SAM-dependent methyltransferase n=1 Tax=Nocardia fusca TaxID=941183 RepID=A0ABV3FA55_9NOCA
MGDASEPPKIRIDLTGAPETMLGTLYAKAVDAGSENPLLGDSWAEAAVRRIDYDWGRTNITKRNSAGVTLRTVHFDTWARDFLARHRSATVLHLGCGLDSRVFRLDPGPHVEWYDIDFPEVIALHEQIYPSPEHYHRIAAPVTEPQWLQTIPPDRPVLMIAEGLTMYLTEEDGIALFRRITEHFPTGELQFDAFNTLGIKAQKINTIVRRSGSTLHWAIDRPDDIVDAVPRTRQITTIPVFESDAFEQGLSGHYQWMAKAMSAIPAVRTIAQYHRYAF